METVAKGLRYGRKKQGPGNPVEERLKDFSPERGRKKKTGDERLRWGRGREVLARK